MHENIKSEALVEQFYETAGADEDMMRNLLHPDFALVEAELLPYAGIFYGLAGWQDFWEKFSECWTDISTANFKMFSNDNMVIARFEMECTARVTGERIVIPLCEVWTFKDGKAIELRPYYFDVAAVRRACGLSVGA